MISLFLLATAIAVFLLWSRMSAMDTAIANLTLRVHALEQRRGRRFGGASGAAETSSARTEPRAAGEASAVASHGT